MTNTLRRLIQEVLYQANAPKRHGLDPIEIDAKNTEIAGDEASKKWFDEKGIRVDPMTVDLRPVPPKKEADFKVKFKMSYRWFRKNFPEAYDEYIQRWPGDKDQFPDKYEFHAVIDKPTIPGERIIKPWIIDDAFGILMSWDPDKPKAPGDDSPGGWHDREAQGDWDEFVKQAYPED